MASGGGTGWRVELLLEARFPVSSFGVDASGDLLIADYSGTLWRLVPAETRAEGPAAAPGTHAR